MNTSVKTPRVSIILPLYKVKTFLAQAIDSVKAQTFTDFECLCLDDGSGNGMAEYARELTQDDPRFKVFEFENAGVATTRNRGLDLAQGEFVGFIDQDDCYHPKYLECMVAGADETGADVVTCLYQYVKEDFDFGTADHFTPTAKAAILENRLRVRLAHPRMIATWTKLYRREKIAKYRFNPKLFGTDDAAFTWHVFAGVDSVAFIDEEFYYYRVQAESVTEKRPMRYMIAFVDYAVDIYPEVKAHLPDIADEVFLKSIGDAIKFVRRRRRYTREEKLTFLQSIEEAFRKYPVPLSAGWNLHRRFVYWRFKHFLF